MTHFQIDTLKQQLQLRDEQLELVRAIDQIRDTLPGPQLLSGIAELLGSHFDAEACILFLVDRHSSKLTVGAVENRTLPEATLRSLLDSSLGQDTVHSTHPKVWASSYIIEQVAPAPADENWHMASIPITMNDSSPLGSIVLIRADQPFSTQHIALLETAEFKVDSAIIQAYAYADLQQRMSEIQTIYRIDHIRDLDLSFDEMLQKVLEELVAIVGAEIGYVMLYDTRDEQLKLKSSTEDDLLEISAIQKVLHEIGQQALKEGQLIHKDQVSLHIRSVICLPLIMQNKRIGVIGVLNGVGLTEFTKADERLLTAIGSQLDTAIFENLEQQRLRKVLGRSVGQNVMDELLLRAPQTPLSGSRREISVMYADIRSSTQLAEKTDPELLVGFMNYFLEEMSRIVLKHDGTIDKFIGDEVMALFNAPLDQADHALRAIKVALEMQEAHKTIQRIWRKLGVDVGAIGVGIATGELVVGEIGSKLHSEYTVMGPAANLGARITGIATSGQVLISPTTYEHVQGLVEAEPLGSQHFQGIEEPITVYRVIRVLDDAEVASSWQAPIANNVPIQAYAPN